MESVNVTKAARHFSELLNRVAYQGASFELWRGNKPVACLVPAVPVQSLPVAALNDLFARLPKLGGDSVDFERDIDAVRASLPEVGDPWAS